MHVVAKTLLLCLIGMVALRPLNAETVTLAPAAGVTTNVLHLFTGDTSVDVAGPGTVLLNPANSHTGGTTLSGGTLEISGNVASGSYSPVGSGSFTISGGTLRGSGSLARDIAGTGAATIEAPNGWTWTGDNTFSAAATVADGTLEIAAGETAFRSGLTVADGAFVSVTGGALGISMASGVGKGTLAINGGTIVNLCANPTLTSNAFNWLLDSLTVKIGPGGLMFKDGGTTTECPRIDSTLSAVAAEAGETALGVTFDGGKWGYYADHTYEGPTIIKNGASLFIGGAGSIPSGSDVMVDGTSQFRIGSTAKTVSSLTLEEGATLGFASTTRSLTVSGSVTLPASAKIALYNVNNPGTAAKNTEDTYAVLKVPAAYADALRAVRWTCATATSGKSYNFSVATIGSTATLSMTIATAPEAGTDITVAAGETLAVAGAVSVGSGNITVDGTMIVPGTLDGTAAGGTVTVNNGGVLDVTGNIRLSSVSGGRFDLYVNDGGTLRAREIDVNPKFEEMAAHSIHFDGATVQLVADGADNNNYSYFTQCASVYIGAGGVTIDLSQWDAEGKTDWYRFSCQGHMDTDPALNGAPDGGITVRGTRDGKAIFYVGSGLFGATLNGGIRVEEGGKISAGENALADDSVTLLPGSMFKAYNKTTTSAIQALTVGEANGSEPVALQSGTYASGPALKVEELSVLSPVEFSTAGYKSASGVWNNDAAAKPGVYTALVYRAVSPALDTSLFRVPAQYASDYSLSAETVALTEGDYAGYTALVLTVAESAVVHDDLEIKGNDAVTISSDATYGNIYVGDLDVVGAPVLTLNGGNVKASTFHLAYQPADGKDATEKHTVSYVQNGGSMAVNAIWSHYRGSDAQKGRVYAEITVNDGLLAVSGDCQFGLNRTRQGYSTTFAMNGGTATVGGNMLLTAYSGEAHAPQGIVLMNAGMLSVGGTIDISSCTNNAGAAYKLDGGLFLRGGVLSAKNITQGAARAPWQRLVFDGGTYAPNAAAAGQTMSGLTTAHVSTNGAIVSTEKLPVGATYTIAQDLLTDPGLVGAADGGFTKRGAGTLALSGANTFTGPTVVEAGTLAISSASAVSDNVRVANGAALDLGGADIAIANVAASGVVENGSLTVARALVLVAGGSLLAVDGDLTLSPGAELISPPLAPMPMHVFGRQLPP